ncbi:YjjG family noncanonical pyrimidine nucleotidase [Emticicia sp. BO119]|uniref:YjjG family noncanonical pyrimidine nucleotidase n=1 Tax=Emticicia sp. BO119 TaxID=2757768 RepID=UPI0015F01865|nr:YjjG family noncanonical pyrimidine nucleotidase [Emticicia sp. BO119]MBA4850844.1 noncanonical pyrimidine nucleotidase, YjjG family [Emticicia sp. BO119]
MYKHLFFDLDHTLWDFEKNSRESLADLYQAFSLQTSNIAELSVFQQEFSVVNKRYWSLLERNEITHEELRRRRFRDTLVNLGVDADETFGLQLNEAFLELLPQKSHLIDGAIEVLDFFAPNYELHILSNGWQHVQVRKISSSKIDHYFKEVITIERAEARKPDKKIFDYAVKVTNAKLSECIMIGDNFEADILGAINAQMDSIFYNPDNIEVTQNPTFEIKRLIELKEIL